MKRFKNILLLTDINEKSRFALERAVDLARRNEGRLTVAGVLHDLPRDLRRLAAALPMESLEEVADQDLRESLESFVASSRTSGQSLEIEVFNGKPFLEIIRAVLRRGHDLVMLAAEGNCSQGLMLLGSTCLHLMRKCPCPVWVLKPSPELRFARILAAVDPDPADVVRDGVNTKVLELAASLAELEGSELHVVHAWEPGEQTLMRRWQSRVSKEQIRDWIAQAREAHQQRLMQLLGKFDLSKLKHQVHLLESEAGIVISKLAGEQQIDLIVMGTVARTGIEGYFIGNTAETVLNQVSCSVLTVKPDGFVSPVKAD